MKKNDLFTLIKSMTKAEKRHFKLSSSKYDKGSKNNYLRLFDLIDRMENYNEEVVSRKFSDINLSYTKNYLFNALLNSLRDFHSDISEDAQLKDMMRNAEILFRRGLYDMCYSVLQKTKEMALQHEKFLLLLEIIECERKVVFRLDRSEEINRVMQETRIEENKIFEKYLNLARYRDLSRTMYLESRNNPAPSTPAEIKPFDTILNDPLLKDEANAISLEACFNYHNALSVYYHATSNWEKLYEQRKKVYELFESKKAKEVLGYDGMFVSLNNYVVACTLNNKHEEALLALQQLKALSGKIINFNKTHFTFTFTLELSILQYLKKFKEACNCLKEYFEHVDLDAPGMQPSQTRLLYYSIAYVLFANGKSKEALTWLEKIISDRENSARPDLLHYGSLLSLIILLDIGELHPEMIRRYMAASKKTGNMNTFEDQFFSFSLEYIDAEPQKKKGLLQNLKGNLVKLFSDKLQARVLHYFDIISWIEAKIQDKPLLDVISIPQPKGDYAYFPAGYAVKPDPKKAAKGEKVSDL